MNKEIKEAEELLGAYVIELNGVDEELYAAKQVDNDIDRYLDRGRNVRR